MKKILLFLLFPTLLYSQIEFLGTVQVDTIRYEWGNTFELLQQLPDGIKTKNKTDIVFFPLFKVYSNSPRYAMKFDNIYYALFTYDKKTKQVVIEQPETWIVEYSLKTKKFKDKKKYDNDIFDSFRPEDLEKKIKDKMKEKEKPKVKP